MEKIFVSWSGGKDCCLACYRVIRAGMKVACLANTLSEDGSLSWSHGIRAGLLRAQAEAMGVPLVQKPARPSAYEDDYKAIIAGLKANGVTGAVFGDIDLAEHRQSAEKLCREAGVAAHLPLWGEDQCSLLKEFIDLGFEAAVIGTRADLLGEEWLGLRLGSGFLRRLEEVRKTVPVTWCGEAGEYHTLVVDGPIFRSRLEIGTGARALRDGHWILDIPEYRVIPKTGSGSLAKGSP